jgi:hypothetical protein
MKYFGQGLYTGRECDFAYNATQMALQWDALATGDTRVMLQHNPCWHKNQRAAHGLPIPVVTMILDWDMTIA